MDTVLQSHRRLLVSILTGGTSSVGCTKDKDGWVDVKTLCRHSFFTLSYLELIIDSFGGFELSSDKKKIRVV